MKASVLKPCPFCKGAAEAWELPCGNGPLYQVGCRHCGIHTTAQSTRQATTKWNRRTLHVRQQLQINKESTS